MIRSVNTLAVLSGGLGAVLRIIAYHYSDSPHGAPEWVFDVDSIGYFLETLWPLLLLLSLDRGSQIPYINIVPASWYTYISLFDACKEVSGINQSHSFVGHFLFWLFFLITTIISYNVYKSRVS